MVFVVNLVKENDFFFLALNQISEKHPNALIENAFDHLLYMEVCKIRVVNYLKIERSQYIYIENTPEFYSNSLSKFKINIWT